MQKSRNREMLHKRRQNDKVGRDILSRQRALAAHDALSSIKESPEAVKAWVARHEEERNQEINNMATQFPELEATQDALIMLGPRIQGIQDKADCLTLKTRMLDLTSTSPSEAHTSARDIVIPDSQPASDLDARDSTEYIDDTDESNDEEEEEEEEDFGTVVKFNLKDDIFHVRFKGQDELVQMSKEELWVDAILEYHSAALKKSSSVLV